MPLTLPKNVRGQRREDTKSLPHPASSTTSGTPVPLMERFSRKGHELSPYVPHPRLILGLGLAPKFPFSVQPSSVLATHMHTCETLEFRLSGLSLGLLAALFLGPFALPDSFQIPGLGSSGPALGMHFILPKLFLQPYLGWGEELGWSWIFFQNSV